MKTIRNVAAAILAIALFTIPGYTTGQTKPTYELRFLNAKFIDTSEDKDVLVLFQVLPIEEKDFPPVLSMKLTYSVGENGVEKTVDIMKSQNKVRISVFGPDIDKKHPDIYTLAKEKLDTSKLPYLVLAIYIDDVASQMFDKMTVTYGLWEKNDLNVRVEKKFPFSIYR